MKENKVLSAINACAIAIASHEAESDVFAAESFGEMIAKVAEVAAYKQIRTEWIGAYIGARGCSEKSGQNRWAELTKLVGFVKPQSEEAAKKQAARAASKVTAPAKGTEVAKAVKLEVTANEAHLLSLIHQGKFEQAHEMLRQMEAAK